MKNIKLNRSTLITGAVMLAIGLFIGWFGKPVSHEHPAENLPETGTSTAIWTCSMHPQIRQSGPGKCPLCGMDLIPLETEDRETDTAAIRMSPTAMQLADVRTIIVGTGPAARELRLNGKIQVDERRVYSQVAHIAGRVEQLAVNFTGEPVRRGQRLASVYSPDLVTAQEELFAALNIKDMQPALFRAAREKLKNWKLTEAQIDQLQAAGKPQERFPILADVSGIVLTKKVNSGDYLMQGMPLYDIADLSRIWALFDVYESDLAWVRVGSPVSFTVRSLPGESFSGKISFIDPVINPVTRVAVARVELVNPGGRLKPEMFAEGILQTRLNGQEDGISVPKSAVLWTGERSIVYVKQGNDQGPVFALREVTLGPMTGDAYLIKAGLQAGEEIAVSGAFSIDAAAQLAGKPSMMNTDARAGKPAAAAAAQTRPVLSPKARAALKNLFDVYFQLKDALVEGRTDAAKELASRLKAAFGRINPTAGTEPATPLWKKERGALQVAINQTATATDLESLRTAFKPLSGQLVSLAKNTASVESTMYVQHCPMADDNNGASWLSLDKSILNPYFGEKMLRCGSVIETIK